MDVCVCEVTSNYGGENQCVFFTPAESPLCRVTACVGLRLSSHPVFDLGSALRASAERVCAAQRVSVGHPLGTAAHRQDQRGPEGLRRHHQAWREQHTHEQGECRMEVCVCVCHVRAFLE